MNIGLIVSIAVIVSMVSVILYVERVFSAGKFGKKKRYALYFVLFMMATMFIGLGWYLSVPPGFLNAIIAINILMIPMIAFLVLLFYFYSLERPSLRNFDRVVFPTFFVLNELLMTYFIFTLLGTRFSLNLSSEIPRIVNSFVFVVPMEVEMVFSILFFNIKGPVRYLLFALAGMDLLSPALFSRSDFLLLVVNALIMVAGMVIIFEETSSSKSKILAERKRIINISMIVYLLNSVGFFVFYAMGSNHVSEWLPYCVSVMIGMWLYFFFIFTGRDTRSLDGWLSKRLWLFFLLLISFLAELIMSVPIGILGGIFQIGGKGIASLSYLVINNAGVVSNFWISLIPFVGAVAASPVFLILMGLEMGSLVVFRMKKIKWLEKRVNLSFALIAYATYTVLAPSYGGSWPMVPLWANVGSQGPVGGILIVPMLMSYVVYAVAVLFFGRRAYCGVLCPSAVMYGGTLGQEMISLNYKTRTSKKMIGSRYSPFIQRVAAGSWGFMFASAAASFLISIGRIRLPFEPAVLYSILIWNVLWYVFFISIPFVGMSPCRRMGWCTTGTFAGFFGKLGVFKIKAVDSSVCMKCPTKDCVTACEVGLGDLPAQFIKKGYFKSQKCVGSGSCITACPYDNIHFYDIRNVIKERLYTKRTDT